MTGTFSIYLTEYVLHSTLKSFPNLLSTFCCIQPHTYANGRRVKQVSDNYFFKQKSLTISEIDKSFILVLGHRDTLHAYVANKRYQQCQHHPLSVHLEKIPSSILRHKRFVFLRTSHPPTCTTNDTISLPDIVKISASNRSKYIGWIYR